MHLIVVGHAAMRFQASQQMLPDPQILILAPLKLKSSKQSTELCVCIDVIFIFISFG